MSKPDADSSRRRSRRWPAWFTRRKPAARTSAWDTGIGPDSVTVQSRYLQVGDGYTCTITVTGYPGEVGPGWMDLVFGYPGRLDASLHIEPIPPAVAAQLLKKQRARLESSRRHDAGKGRLDDPDIEAAAESSAELAGRLARGETRLFRLAIYLTVHGSDPEDLAERVSEVRTLAASLLLGTQPVTWRQLEGWIATLPLGVDTIGMRRTFDTLALASAFPFTSPDVPHPSINDVFYGLNTGGPGVVSWDRWSQENYNMIILGRSGAGKSYLGKLDLIRNLYRRIEACVIDPDDEYVALADHLRGEVIRPGHPDVKINPFDLCPDDKDALNSRAMFCNTLVQMLVGKLSADEVGVLDRAVMAAYQARGVTFDPRTWQRTPPLMTDLIDTLNAAGPTGQLLAARLGPYVTGSFSRLFNGHTTHRADKHLVVYAIKDLPDELQAVGTLLCVDQITKRINAAGRAVPLLVHIDEAWKLLADGAGAAFLLKLAKGARKLRVGLTVLTQDALDVLSTTGGQKVVANCATQILLKQATQAIGAVAKEFSLTEGESTYLLSAPLGHALLLGSGCRVGFTALADAEEHDLVSTARAR